VRNWLQIIFYKVFRLFILSCNELKLRYYNYLFFKNVSKVGDRILLSGKVSVINNAGLTVGSGVCLGDNIELRCHAGIIICDNVKVEDNCKLYSSYPICKDRNYNELLAEMPGSIIIGKGTVIGKGSIIRTGLNVPPDSVIPPFSIIKNEADLINILELNNETNLVGEVFDKVSVLEKYELAPEELVFVFSTGRSGSNAIENLANKNPKINAFHEPFYSQLKTLAFEYSAGIIDCKMAESALRKIYYNAPIAKKSKIYLESDQKLVPFIKIISKIFPKAKFIWLIRSPESFLRSAKARGWFLEDYPNFSNGKILITPEIMSDACRATGDYCGEFSSQEWFDLSHDDRILWYWKYWNNLIENQFNDIHNEKIILKLEEINDRAESFFKFICGEYKSEWHMEVTNKMKKKHIQNYSEDVESKHYDIEKLRYKYDQLNINSN